MKVGERFKIFKPCKLPGKEKKSAMNAFYVYIVSLVCFTPHLIAGKPLVVDNSCLLTLEVV